MIIPTIILINTLMDPHRPIALSGRVKMAMSIAGHCHGPTIVSRADQDCNDDGCGFSVVLR